MAHEPVHDDIQKYDGLLDQLVALLKTELRQSLREVSHHDDGSIDLTTQKHPSAAELTEHRELDAQVVALTETLEEVRESLGVDPGVHLGIDEWFRWRTPEPEDVTVKADDSAGGGPQEGVLLTVLTRSDLLVDPTVFTEDDIGPRMYESVHESGGWDALLTLEGVQPIVRFGVIGLQRELLTQDQVTAFPDEDSSRIFELESDGIVRVVVDQWAALA